MNPDEDIVLNIGANTVDVEAALNRLHQEVQQAFGSSDTKVRNYGIQLDRVTERIERQVAAMRRLANQRVVSDDYRQLEQYVNRTADEFIRVRDILEQMRNSGQRNSDAYKQMYEYSLQLSDALFHASERQMEMEQNGTQYTLGRNTEEYARMNRELQRMGVQAGIFVQRIAEARRGAGSLRNSFIVACKDVIAHIKRVGQFINQHIASRTNNARKETRGFGEDAKVSFKKALSFLIRYGIGMASLFRLYRRLRVWTKEAMQTMGKAIPEIGQQILDVSNAAVQLKNSLATVAQPLFTYLLPAIQTVISALVTAMNTLANFFAMLTGQGYIYKAAKGNKKLADSIGGAGKAAKEAKEEIAEYDKLIVLDQPNAGGGGGGAGGAADDVAGSFEKVDGKMTHFIQDIQKMWDVFKQAWERKGKKVMDAWNKAFGAVKKLITDIWHTIVEVFTDGTGLAWVESILDVFASVLDTIYLIADAINKAWNKDGNGYKFIKSIFDMWTRINELIDSIIKAWNKAWTKDDVGVSIVEHILHIFTDINETIGLIATKLKEAWEYDDNGETIFDTVLSLIDGILADIEEMSEETKKWAEHLDLVPLVTSIKDAFVALKPYVQDVADIVKELYTTVILPLSKLTIEFVIPTGIESVSEIIDDIHTSLSALFSLFVWASPLASKLAQALKDITGLDIGRDGDPLREFIEWIDRMNIVKAMPKPIQWLIQLGDIIKTLQSINWSELWENMWSPKGGEHGQQQLYTRDKNPLFQSFDGLGDGLIKGLTSPFDDFDIVQWCKDNIVQPIKDFFGIHSPSKLMKGIGKNIMQGLWNGMLEILKKMQKKLPEETKFIPALFGGTAGAVVTNWETVEEGLGNAWDNVKEKYSEVGSWMHDKFNLATQGVKQAWSTITPFFQNSINNIKNDFAGVAPSVKASGALSYKEFTDAFSGIGKWATNTYNSVTGAFSGLDSYMSKNGTKAYNSLVGSFSGTSKAFTGVSNSITTAMNNAWTGVTNAMNSTKASNQMKGVADAMKAPFTGFANFVKNEFGNAWENIKQAFKNTGSSINSAGNNIVDSMKSMLNSIIDRFNRTIGNTVEQMNQMIDKMNRNFRNVSGYKQIPRVNQPLIPRYAKGAVIPPNKEFLAILGDQKQGTNIETPLSTMVEAFKMALYEGNYGGSGNQQPIILQLDGRTVAEVVWDENNKQYKQTGRPIFA